MQISVCGIHFLSFKVLCDAENLADIADELKNPILLWKGGLPQWEVLVMLCSTPTGPLILLGPLKHILYRMHLEL